MKTVNPKKYLGQHFLNDSNIAKKIVDSIGVNPVENLLEVGPGTGKLTELLIQRNDINFKAVEIDPESVFFLKEKFPILNDRIIHGDFLKVDIPAIFPHGVSIIGNFPYNISSQIFFRIIEYRDFVPLVIGMLQKEVALRICSAPGSKNYGILSVLLQTFYNATFLFIVSPQVFTPPPKVNSAVIKLIRNDKKHLECNEILFFKIVKTAFNQRRKMLRNSLSSFGVKVPVEFAMLRPEQLTVDEFILLTLQMQSAKSKINNS